MGRRDTFNLPGGLCDSVLLFFQAEDGIRGYKVTGVQTCALPICNREPGGATSLEHRFDVPCSLLDRPSLHDVVDPALDDEHVSSLQYDAEPARDLIRALRSEERRVGKECRSRWSPYH